MKRKLLLFVLIVISLTGCDIQSSFEKNINNIIKEYNEGTVTYNSAKSSLESAEAEADNEEKREYLYRNIELLNKLNESKNNFDKAEKMIEEQDYKTALACLEKVVSEDTNYEQVDSLENRVKTSWMEAVNEQADKYVSEGKYTNAIELYVDATKYIEDESFTQKAEEIKTLYVQDVETNVSQFIGEKKYAEALSLYRELSEYMDDKEYEVKIEGIEDEYTNESIQKAEKLMEESDFQTAAEIIDKTLDVVKTSGLLDELLKESDRIKSFTPIFLTDIAEFCREEENNTVGSYSSIEEWESTDIDNLGNGDATGLKFKLRTYIPVDIKSSVTYLVGGMYDTLTGSFVLHENSKNLTGENYGVQLLIYCDGELSYKSELMQGGIKPIDINVDISDVDELKIEFYTIDSYAINVGFVQPVLQKKFVPLSGEGTSSDTLEK